MLWPTSMWTMACQVSVYFSCLLKYASTRVSCFKHAFCIGSHYFKARSTPLLYQALYTATKTVRENAIDITTAMSLYPEYNVFSRLSVPTLDLRQFMMSGCTTNQTPTAAHQSMLYHVTHCKNCAESTFVEISCHNY